MTKSLPQLDGRQRVMRDFALAAAERGEHFFYVLIREPLTPMARGDKYELPLSEALGELGEVIWRVATRRRKHDRFLWGRCRG